MIYFKSKAITITNYGDFKFLVRLTIPATNTPVDLTGSTLYMTIKADREIATTPILSLSQATHFDAVNGQSIIDLTKTQSQTLAAGQYIYEVAIFQGGLLKPFFQSDFFVEQALKLS